MELKQVKTKLMHQSRKRRLKWLLFPWVHGITVSSRRRRSAFSQEEMLANVASIATRSKNIVMLLRKVASIIVTTSWCYTKRCGAPTSYKMRFCNVWVSFWRIQPTQPQILSTFPLFFIYLSTKTQSH